jgi:hypothetical protein
MTNNKNTKTLPLSGFNFVQHHKKYPWYALSFNNIILDYLFKVIFSTISAYLMFVFVMPIFIPLRPDENVVKFLYQIIFCLFSLGTLFMLQSKAEVAAGDNLWRNKEGETKQEALKSYVLSLVTSGFSALKISDVQPSVSDYSKRNKGNFRAPTADVFFETFCSYVSTKVTVPIRILNQNIISYEHVIDHLKLDIVFLDSFLVEVTWCSGRPSVSECSEFEIKMTEGFGYFLKTNEVLILNIFIKIIENLSLKYSDEEMAVLKSVLSEADLY